MYVDDGKSYQNQNGHYTYSEFKFEKGVLTSSLLNIDIWKPSVAASLKSDDLKSRIEKIEVVGLGQNIKNVKVEVEGRGIIHSAFKRVATKEGEKIIVKNPGVGVHEEWSMIFD